MAYGGVPMVPGIDSFGNFAAGAQYLDTIQNVYNSSGATDPMSADIGLLSMGGGVAPNATFNVTGNATMDPMTGGFFGSKLSQLYYSDPAEYYKELQKLNKVQLDNNVKDKHQQAGAEFSANAHEETVAKRIGELQAAIQKNDQKNVLHAYQRMRADVAQLLIEEGAIEGPRDKETGRQLTQFGDFDGLTQARISTRAELEYKKATGNLLTDDLEKCGDSEFTHGFKQLFGFGILSKSDISAKDNKVNITGIDDRTGGDEAIKTTGQIVGGVATAAIIGLLLFKGLPEGGCAALSGSGAAGRSIKGSWTKFISKICGRA